MTDQTNLGLIIRTENPEDYTMTEALVREAFWNRYAPGASEHYILHLARKQPDFETWHSLVAEYDGHIIAQCLLVPSQVDGETASGKAFYTLGPVCVLPAVLLRGIGSAIIKAAIQTAKENKADAIFLSGDPRYYHRFGFTSASRFGIHLPDMERTEEAAFFMALPLHPDALDGVQGLYRENPVYETDPAALAAYDMDFPIREKLWLPGQLVQKPE